MLFVKRVSKSTLSMYRLVALLVAMVHSHGARLCITCAKMQSIPRTLSSGCVDRFTEQPSGLSLHSAYWFHLTTDRSAAVCMARSELLGSLGVEESTAVCPLQSVASLERTQHVSTKRWTGAYQTEMKERPNRNHKAIRCIAVDTGVLALALQ